MRGPLQLGRVLEPGVLLVVSGLAFPELSHAGESQRTPVLLSVQASDAFRRGDLASAEQLFRSAIAACQPSCESEPSLRNQLGRVLEDLSRLDEAEREYRRVIEVNTTAAEPIDLETASALNNLASIEQARGLSKASDDLLKQAYSIIESNHAGDTALGGLVLSNMGLNAQKHGQYDEARSEYARAAAILREAESEQSQEFARVLKNWALLDFETGQLNAALQKNVRVLEIENALPYISAADKAVTLNNHGLVLAALERPAEAEKAYAECIQLTEGRPRLELALAKTLNNLANVEKEEGRFQAASEHAGRALELAQRQTPKQDTTVASVFNSMGLISLRQNRLAEAKASFEKAQALWLVTVGDAHPNYAATLSNLAVVATRQRRHKDAQQLLEKALAIAERRQGPEHPRVASILSNLAVELVSQKRYEEALQNYQRAKEIQERAVGAHTMAVARLWRDMAVTYGRLNDFDSSAAAYDKAVQSLRTIAGPDAPELAGWLQEYAGVLKKRHQYGDAERAETESLRIQVRNTLKTNQKSVSAGS